MTPRNVSAILLSAGLSKRAQSFKPLQIWPAGNPPRTYLETVYGALVESGSFNEILVVTGHESARLEPLLDKMSALWVENAAYEFGMHGSIRVGLETLTPGWDGALIALVDQPHLRAQDYRGIVASFLCEGNPARAERKHLVRPKFRGTSGNPAIIGARYLSEIQNEPNQDRGCAYLFQRHPEAVIEHEMPTDAVLCDFDIAPPPMPNSGE